MGAKGSEDRIYAFGYGPAAVGMMEDRSAEQHASFFLEHLSPGIKLLDIGCGPGSITVGLAGAVSPGEVIGIDIEPSQIALGRSRAESLGLSNCRFETGSVYALPMKAQSVDAVFGHTILMQFRDVDPVLAEVRRVLKPGGFVGFREVDFGASVYHPADSAMETVMSTLRRAILYNDGNPDIGRALASILSHASFEILSATATYGCASTPQAKKGSYAAVTDLWNQSDFVAQAESLGWISAQDRSETVAKLELEAADPGSFSGMTFAEVVARERRA